MTLALTKAGDPPPPMGRHKLREFLPQEFWPPERVNVAPYNPRSITDEEFAALKRGIEEFGLLGGLDVRAEDGLCMGGHQRLRAAADLIAEHRDDEAWLAAHHLAGGLVPVNPVAGVSDQDAMAINVLLNNPNAQGTFDMPALASMLSNLDGDGFDATLTGFSSTQVEQMILFDAGQKAGDETEDIPPTPRVAVSQGGDLYILGRHRLVVGDARDPHAWHRLLGGTGLDLEVCDMVWSDPPYNVKLVGRTKEKLTIENDDIEPVELLALLASSLGLTFAHCRMGAPWYVCGPPGPGSFEFMTVLRDLGVWRQTIAWVKDTFVLGHSDFHYQHESIFYGWKPGVKRTFNGDRTNTTTWHVDRPRRNKDNPSEKPLELVTRAIDLSAETGALVCDPFGGSGPVVIACEQKGMRARVLDNDPRQADVIVRRWRNLTHGEVQRFDAAGDPVEEVP